MTPLLRQRLITPTERDSPRAAPQRDGNDKLKHTPPASTHNCAAQPLVRDKPGASQGQQGASLQLLENYSLPTDRAGYILLKKFNLYQQF
jgi:hypothetical protein